ncbi:MAG: hypothetical protein ACJ8FY_07620 [Gemmataceae bacterium]
MTSLPWYLLAAGIILVIIGSLLAGVMRPPGSGRVIDPRMRDDEIIRNLKSGQRITLPNIVIFVGLLCILVSVLWRLALLIASAVHSAT